MDTPLAKQNREGGLEAPFNPNDIRKMQNRESTEG